MMDKETTCSSIKETVAHYVILQLRISKLVAGKDPLGLNAKAVKLWQEIEFIATDYERMNRRVNKEVDYSGMHRRLHDIQQSFQSPLFYSPMYREKGKEE